jgi:ubiquinone biosynthesis protein UbiJ
MFVSGEAYTITASKWAPTLPTTSFTIDLRELALWNRIAVLERKVAELEARIKKLEEEKRK